MCTLGTPGKIVSAKKQEKNQVRILEVKIIITEVLKTYWMGYCQQPVCLEDKQGSQNPRVKTQTT